MGSFQVESISCNGFVKFKILIGETSRMIFTTPKLFNAGLGNLIFPLSKAYLASQALDCKLLIPVQLDTKRCKIYFNPIKMGYFPYIPNPIKKVVFTFEDYKNIMYETNTNDYLINVKAFVDKLEFKNFILINEGMWGGYQSIYRARNWIKNYLISSRKPRKIVSEVGTLFDAKKIQIGFHIRRGDFKKATTHISANQNSDQGLL